jgi:ribosomal protein S18 acetylase RimI-like enzyme
MARKGEDTVSTRVREAKSDDDTVIAVLIRELASGEGEVSTVSERTVADYLAVPGNGVLLAEKDGQILGLISYSIRPNLYHAADSCLIEELIVRQEARGSGVGRILVEDLMKRCMAHRCAEISVSTMPDNKRAIRFYRKLGFTDEALFLERHLEK